MLRNDFTTVINRPVEDVFAFVTDLTRTPEWRTTVRQADALQWKGVFGRVAVPMIAWGMRREARTHVENLKDILEN